jgi:hypothetical protein
MDFVEEMAKMKKDRINWDQHEKVNIFTTPGSFIISYKQLDESNKDHLVLKKLYKPFGKNKILIETELSKDAKKLRKNNNKSLEFFEDGSINFQKAPSHFLFERIASCSENNLIASNIEQYSREFENGYEINIGKFYFIFNPR